jgi:hypothetical protein
MPYLEDMNETEIRIRRELLETQAQFGDTEAVRRAARRELKRMGWR